MDGNEEYKEVCSKCAKDMDDQDFFECDCCLVKTHKTCAALSSSELRVMPLQKRLLMFICDSCKIMLRKMPMIIGMIESLKDDISNLKSKFEPERNLQTVYQSKTYAEKVSGVGNQIENVPSLIIKPKRKQNSKKTEADLHKNIKPSAIQVKVKNTKEINDGGIIIKCSTKDDIDKLQKEAQRALSSDYEVHISKLKSPRLKIVDVSPKYTETSLNQIEDDLRNQNSIILDSDHLKVVHMKEHKNKNKKTIYLECSPELFHRCIRNGRVYLGWEGYRIYEDITVRKCYNCQGYNHKGESCKNQLACGYCMGSHETKQCSKPFKKCANCTSANSRYNKNHDVSHETNDPLCPSYKYMLGLLRGRIDYGKQ